MTNKEILKKQILYRSLHRGTKEMDILLGNFVKENINTLTDLDLIDLNNIIKLEDDVLQKWYFEEEDNNTIPINNVSNLLKKFKP